MSFQPRHIPRKLVFIVLALSVAGGLVMLLWNAVMPTLFGDARAIGYWHALGLLVLCRILFGGFRGGGGWHHRGHGRQHWQAWQAMSAAERAQMQRGVRPGWEQDEHE